MTFFDKISDYEYLLRIRVKLNAHEQAIILSIGEDFLTVCLRSKAIKNKANFELINLIRKICMVESKNVQFVSGMKNTSKTLKITFTKSKLENEFLNLFKD
jgi:uncharacterized protein (TIGR00251 family)